MRQHLRAVAALLAVALVAAGGNAFASPWIETASFFRAGGSSSAYFGRSVALDGDVAVVGLPFPGLGPHPSGIAYVFVRSGSVWTEVATLLPSVSAPDDDFGFSVAISGDTIVVGSPGASMLGLSHQGLAFVFVRPDSGWAGTLTSGTVLLGSLSEGQADPDRLGFSVAISGGTIVAGAPGTPVEGEVDRGAVFLYAEPADGWQANTSYSPTATLVASDGAVDADLGYSVGVSGDNVVGGAPFAAVGTVADAGKAYVWGKPPGGWVCCSVIDESAGLFPSDAINAGEFGFTAAIDGTTAVFGNHYASTSDPTNHDKGYVFEEPSAGWEGTLNENAQLLGSDATNASEFGDSVSISGDTVVIGAPFADTPFSAAEGTAYVFNKPSVGWSGAVGQFAKIYRGIGPSADAFGFSVAISDMTILAGAPGETINGHPSQGAVHVFEPGLNPTVTASFSPGSVLTHQASTVQFLVSNPNSVGFLANFGFDVTLPSGLFVDATPDILSSCGPADVEALPGSSSISVSGGTIMAGWICASDVNVSTGLPGAFTIATSPVSCDQGCDGAGSPPATLLVRLRATQIRFLVKGPVRVAPGVPVEFPFEVDALQRTSLPIGGEVVVSDGAEHSCRGDVSVSGKGSCTLTFGARGRYRIRAEYLGNLSFGGSTSPPLAVFVGPPGSP